MAVTVPGLFFATFRDILDTTNLNVDLEVDTNRLALFTNSITPNYSTDTAYGVAPYNANEVANGNGYTTGGELITGTTVTESPTGTLMWDASDVQWTSATFTARAALAYAAPLAGDNAIVLIDFDNDYPVTAGTFLIQWASGGIFNIDLTPAA
jgi:hypothetical protein